MTTPAIDLEAQVQSLMAATGLPEATVRKLLIAQEQQAGEPIHNVRFDPASRAIAHRVLDKGVPKWRISHPEEGVSYEMAPTKPDWPLIANAETGPAALPEPTAEEEPADPNP